MKLYNEEDAKLIRERGAAQEREEILAEVFKLAEGWPTNIAWQMAIDRIKARGGPKEIEPLFRSVDVTTWKNAVGDKIDEIANAVNALMAKQ